MGYPYRGKADQRLLILSLVVLIPLAIANLVVLVPLATPWIHRQGVPAQRLLMPILVIVGIVLVMAEWMVLVITGAILWRLIRRVWIDDRAEADAAFAVSEPAAAVVPVKVPDPGPGPIGEPAAVLMEWIPERRGRMGWFDVHVDDRPVWTVTGEGITPIPVPAGPHRIFIKLNHMKSDVVEVDLAPYEILRLDCGMKPLIRNRVFRFFEKKFKYVVIPVGLVCYCFPPAMRVLKEHFAVEFLTLTFLGLLGFYASFPRLFSRKPGAMVSLVVREGPVDAA